MRKLTFVAALAAPLLALAQATTGGTGVQGGAVGTPGAGAGAGGTTTDPQSGAATSPGTVAPGVTICPPGTVPDNGTASGTGQGGMSGTGSTGGTAGDLTPGGSGATGGTGSTAAGDTTAGGTAGTTGGTAGVRCVPIGATTPGTDGRRPGRGTGDEPGRRRAACGRPEAGHRLGRGGLGRRRGQPRNAEPVGRARGGRPRTPAHGWRLLGCRMSLPRTMKTTISARFVAWSPKRSRCFAANMTRGRAPDVLRVLHHEEDQVVEDLEVERVEELVAAHHLLGLRDVAA